MDSFNNQQQFCRADLSLMGLDRALMCEIRWSKTIQHRQKILRLPVLPAKNKAICPVFWTHYMISKVPAGPQDPVLTLRVGSRILALSPKPAHLKVLQMVNTQWSRTHYILVTFTAQRGATFAYQSNMEGNMIKLLGD